MLQPAILTTFILLAISSTGCLFSGRPCAPGNWRYHSYGCQHTTGPGECRTCETPPLLENLEDTQVHPDRPMIQPTPEKIPPLPLSTTGATGQSRSFRKRTPQVAQVEWNEPFRPKMSTKTGSEPDTAENTVAAGVQQISWQQPDDMPSRSAPEANAPEETARNNGVPVSKPQSVPYAWGYFGASGRW